MKKTFLAAILLLSSVFLSGKNDKSILSVVSPDSLNVFLRDYLEQTTGKKFEDPKVPRFLISDRNDFFVFGIGGYVGAKLFYDYGGNDKAGFSPVDAALTAHNNDVLALDLTSTRFSFKVLGNTKIGITEAYLEAGFSGAGKTLSLKKAYLNLLGFRVGISLTAMSDVRTIPVICDDAVISFNDRNVPMIAYSYLFKNGLRLQGGFEFPQSTTIYSSSEPGLPRQVVTVEMPKPDAVVSAYYDKNNLHLYGGACLRVMQFYDKYNTGSFKNTPGYTFNVSGNYKIKSSPNFSQTIFLQAQYEYMMADCFSTLQNKGLSAIMPNRLGWTYYDYTNGLGGQFGYKMDFGDNSVNLQINGNKIFGHEKSGFPDLYQEGFMTTANYMRKFCKYGTIGGEAVFGRHYTLGGNVLSDFRVVALLRYDF